jgi:Uma2 family endonuclease
VEPHRKWTLDLADPRAPTEAQWAQMSNAERRAVVDSLPSEIPVSESQPPEGDLHTEVVYDTRSALRRYYGRDDRRIYVGTSLPVYYPGRPLFSPDVLAVVDVPTHPRNSWIVSEEGRGLDFALEVVVAGNRKKDLERNRVMYAELGISEYFVFERVRLRLHGFRLRGSNNVYEPIAPQHGRYASSVLGLDLMIEANRLRFYQGEMSLPTAEDFVGRLQSFMDDFQVRLDEAERRAEEEGKRAEEESKRAEELEARLADALAELSRLKR